MHPKAAAANFAPSSRRQDDPQYSPDGKHIAFTSSREGPPEIWLSDADETNLIKLSDANTTDAAWPRWSPDSQKITFSSKHSGHWEVYVVDTTERLPRRLECGTQVMLVSSWSHDGKQIYFQGDGEKIYRCPATGGKAEALSQGSGFNPWESSDGKVLYFADRLDESTIRMEPLQKQGIESTLPGIPKISNAGSFVVVPRGIYFMPFDTPRSLHYFDFATKRLQPVFDVNKFFRDPSVSPDGHWVLYTEMDEGNADLMLVENFY